MKWTMVVCFVFSLVCVSFSQEPINHSVSQPTASQATVQQQSVSQPGILDYTPVQPFAFQPLLGIPHAQQQPSASQVTVDRAEDLAIVPPGQPTVRQPAVCGCGAR